MSRPAGSVREVFTTFLALGLRSFGGPVAHLGYFRAELVTRRQWLSDAAYADLVALCQFLPGPASSQVGFALGLARAGWAGALAAFVAFTLPSALILAVFALGAGAMSGPLAEGALHGLKLVAVAIVAQAVLGMARSLCPDRIRASIAVLAVVMLAVLPVTWGMIAAICVGALLGRAILRGAAGPAAVLELPVTRRQGLIAAAVVVALLIGLPLAAGLGQGVAVFDAFTRAGALVFGGGHVVLPLLEAETVARGWLSPDAFLAGYGAAQAIPGPLFTFAAYLGAALEPVPNGMLGASLALIAIFLPGFLILIAALPFWHRLRATAGAQTAMQGANAAVVGILGAALFDPVFSSAVGSLADLSLALAGFVALNLWKAPAWSVVLVGALAGMGLALI